LSFLTSNKKDYLCNKSYREWTTIKKWQKKYEIYFIKEKYYINCINKTSEQIA